MFSFLYENIGRKIKSLAMCLFFVEAIGSLIAGIALGIEVEEIYFLLVLIGPFIAWISSFIMYAFGELVEDTESIRKNIVVKTTFDNDSNISSNKTNNIHINTKRTSSATSNNSANIYWTCSACKRENSVDRKECWNCGNNRSNS